MKLKKETEKVIKDILLLDEDISHPKGKKNHHLSRNLSRIRASKLRIHLASLMDSTYIVYGDWVLVKQYHATHETVAFYTKESWNKFEASANRRTLDWIV